MARARSTRTRSKRRQRGKRKRPEIFYAYPHTPQSLHETLQSAIRELRQHEDIKKAKLSFKPWTDIAIPGRSIVRQITNQIDNSAIVACDVTYPNANVAFEIGYSIGSFKRIWLSLDTSIERAPQDFARSYTGMLGIGYARYENHNELTAALLQDKPWATIDQPLLGQAYRNIAPHSETPTLLYTMPPIKTDAVIAVRETIDDSIFESSLILDDPIEISRPTLEWYVDKIAQSDAVLVHLLSDHHRDAFYHNSKASCVSGLAHAMHKPLLMLAHAPFDCPTDYETLLHTHNTPQESIAFLQAWISSLAVRPRRSRRPLHTDRPPKDSFKLRDLELGEPVAENEKSRLDEYFVETSSFYDALGADVSIFVGRRGTGKTASFIALTEAFRRNKRNHVCTIQPVGL